MDVVDVRRGESDSVVLRNGKVWREPLEFPRRGMRDLPEVLTPRIYRSVNLGEGAVVDDRVKGGVN